MYVMTIKPACNLYPSGWVWLVPLEQECVSFCVVRGSFETGFSNLGMRPNGWNVDLLPDSLALGLLALHIADTPDPILITR